MRNLIFILLLVLTPTTLLSNVYDEIYIYINNNVTEDISVSIDYDKNEISLITYIDNIDMENKDILVYNSETKTYFILKSNKNGLQWDDRLLLSDEYEFHLITSD